MSSVPCSKSIALPTISPCVSRRERNRTLLAGQGENILAGQLAANHPDDALQYLREAINRGYKDADGLMADPDLEKLHPNPNFQQLVAELKTHARNSSAQ